MNLPTLWLLRHGASTMSGTGRWQGWLDVGLSELGRRQASERRFAADIPAVKHAFSSPLRRCVETGKIILPGVSLVLDERLRTRYLGEWEGLTTEQIHQKTGYWYTPFAEYTPPGGESINSVRQRVDSFIKDMSLSYGSHVVITHGAIIGLILSWLDIEPVIIPACSFVVVKRTGKSWKLIQGPSGSVPPV